MCQLLLSEAMVPALGTVCDLLGEEEEWDGHAGPHECCRVDLPSLIVGGAHVPGKLHESGLVTSAATTFSTLPVGGLAPFFEPSAPCKKGLPTHRTSTGSAEHNSFQNFEFEIEVNTRGDSHCFPGLA